MNNPKKIYHYSIKGKRIEKFILQKDASLKFYKKITLYLETTMKKKYIFYLTIKVFLLKNQLIEMLF